ncbi:MAG: hypothetical protein K2N71_05165 [Oscillospiraceae bacterium]|nr:hypothetical protein [Oscillospiraceae bacterium]
MHKKFLLCSIFTALVCLTACSNGDTEVTETSMTTASESVSAAEQTTVTETETEMQETETVPQIAFANAEAENYYNIIMNDMSWCNDDLMNAAIIDVNGDGVPEFITTVATDSKIGYGVTDAEMHCYSFGKDKLEFMYSFAYMGYGAMAKYDDDGKTKWWGYVQSRDDWDYEGDFCDKNHKSETTYGLFEFTESGLVMTDELFYMVKEYDSENDIFQREMYINGEHYGTDRTEAYSKAEGVAFETYLDWFGEISDWQLKNLTAEENYVIHAWEPFWAGRVYGYEDISAEECIAKRVNAYCQNNKNYLTRDVDIIAPQDLPCTY